jgi:predicted amidohydrolase YtcJ
VGNTLALLRAGIAMDRDVYEISGGAIDTFPLPDNAASGTLPVTGPTGVLRETAVEIMYAAMGSRAHQSDEHKTTFLTDGLNLCVSNGITSVHTNDELCVKVYKQLQQSDKLPIRVFLTPYVTDLDVAVDNGGALDLSPVMDPAFLTSAAVEDHGNKNSLATGSSRLAIQRVKILADGSLGAETAALRRENPQTIQTIQSNGGAQPDTKPKGILYYDDESLRSKILRAKECGYRVEIHAIGDAAAQQVRLIMTELLWAQRYVRV